MLIYFYFVVSHLLLYVGNIVRMPFSVYTLIIMIPYSLVAYFYDPALQQAHYGGDGVDLYRHFETLDLMRVGMADDMYIEAPLSAAFFRIIATCFYDNHMLPLLSAWICYALCFVFVVLVCRHLQVKKYIMKISIFVILCMFNFFGVMANIRYPIAVALVAVVLYFDVIKNLKMARYLYLLPLLIHPGTGMFLIIRLLAGWRLRYSWFFLGIMSLLVVANFENMVQQLIGVVSFSPELQMLLLGISLKTFNYSTKEIYVVPLIFRVLSVYAIVIYSTFFALAINYKCQIMKNIVFYRFVLIMILVTSIGIITNFMDGNFTERIIVILPFMSAVMVADILRSMNYCSRLLKLVIKFVIITLPMSFVSIYLFKIYLNWIYLGL